MTVLMTPGEWLDRELNDKVVVNLFDFKNGLIEMGYTFGIDEHAVDVANATVPFSRAFIIRDDLNDNVERALQKCREHAVQALYWRWDENKGCVRFDGWCLSGRNQPSEQGLRRFIAKPAVSRPANTRTSNDQRSFTYPTRSLLLSLDSKAAIVLFLTPVIGKKMVLCCYGIKLKNAE